MYERKKLEEHRQKEGRLPPGQSLTLKFPVLHYGPIPPLNLPKWDFRIWGEVENEMKWTWDEFNQLPRKKLNMDIHCVTRWSMLNTDWEGVSINDLIDYGYINLLPTAKFCIQHAEHGFTANLPLEVILSDVFLLATYYQGEPITPEHGYPLRGIVGNIPGNLSIKAVYFWKGAKWLRGLEFTNEDHLGFWEQAGYHNEADVWKEQRTIYDV